MNNNEKINSLTLESIDLLRGAYQKLDSLSRERAKLKFSNSRTSGVARELNELIKVLSRDYLESIE